jgi:hypothetical protein
LWRSTRAVVTRSSSLEIERDTAHG